MPKSSSSSSLSRSSSSIRQARLLSSSLTLAPTVKKTKTKTKTSLKINSNDHDQNSLARKLIRENMDLVKENMKAQKERDENRRKAKANSAGTSTSTSTSDSNIDALLVPGDDPPIAQASFRSSKLKKSSSSYSSNTDFSEFKEPTEYAWKVWDALLTIPEGKVVTYGRLAEMASGGKKGGARSVGAPLRSNPLAPLIPCHRIVSSTYSLHGYSGSLDPFSPELLRKKELLIKEGVDVMERVSKGNNGKAGKREWIVRSEALWEPKVEKVEESQMDSDSCNL